MVNILELMKNKLPWKRSWRVRERLRLFLLQFTGGLQDSVALPRVIRFYAESSKMQYDTLQVVGLNGLLLLGSHYLYTGAIAPTLHAYGAWLFRGSAPPQLEAFVGYGAYLVYQMCWMWPFYLVSFFVSIGYYQDIADEAYVLMLKRSSCASSEVSRAVKDLVARMVMVYALLAQAIFLHYSIPLGPVGPMAAFLLTCWLDAFYAFQYVWARVGIDVDTQTNIIERHWAYFLGFGFLPAVLSSVTSYFVGAGIYGVFFPLCILLALRSQPPVPGIPNLTAPAPHTDVAHKDTHTSTQTTSAAHKDAHARTTHASSNAEGELTLGRAPVFKFARKVAGFLVHHVRSLLTPPTSRRR